MLLKWIGTVPWVALLLGMPLFNATRPFVLGLPLPLFWGVVSTLISAAALALVYRLDPANRP